MMDNGRNEQDQKWPGLVSNESWVEDLYCIYKLKTIYQGYPFIENLRLDSDSASS